MKKAFLIIPLLLIVIIVAAIFIGWEARASIAARMIHRALNVPVTIQSLDISKTEAAIDNLWIGNPPGFQTKTAFKAEKIYIDSTWAQIRGDPLVIDEITMENLMIGLEKSKGTDTNWTRILAHDTNHPQSKRHYLIKTLIFRNLTVQVTDANGKTKTYPTIPQMEFHNISDQTGFPADEIEKAIFNMMMQDIFNRFNDLQNLIKPIIPGGSYLPNLPFSK